MRTLVYVLLTRILLFTSSSAFGQRPELAVSPVGLLYERYSQPRQSLTVSVGYDIFGRSLLFGPPRAQRFTSVRGGVGYRYYVPLLDDDITLFGSARAIVDYSVLRLRTDARYPIPADSLRAAGFSVAPEVLLGGKIRIFERVALSGAVGMQYLFKLYPTRQLTRNQAYWDAEYWTNDNQTWEYKRNVAVNHRRGWYPSFLVTVGVVLGKRPR